MIFNRESYCKEIARYVNPDELTVRNVVSTCGGVCGEVVTTKSYLFDEEAKTLTTRTSQILEVYNDSSNAYVGKGPVDHILLSTTQTQSPLS